MLATWIEMGMAAMPIQVRFAMEVLMTEISKQTPCVAIVEEDLNQVGSEYLITISNTSNLFNIIIIIVVDIIVFLLLVNA